MKFFKKLWPTCFKIKKGNIGSFLIQLLIFILVCFVAGLIIGQLGKILGGIPIIGTLISIVGSLVGLYGFIGVVLCILKVLGVIK